MGTLVCPVMPILGVATMAINFLTNHLVVTVTCHPPAKRWNQPRRNSFLMGLTATTLLIVLVPVSLVITRFGNPSSPMLPVPDTGKNPGDFVLWIEEIVYHKLMHYRKLKCLYNLCH